jgi:hypothetical protein
LDQQANDELSPEAKGLYNKGGDGDNGAYNQHIQSTAGRAKDSMGAMQESTDSTKTLREAKSDSYRRQTIRKDGRTRTHKRKTPPVMGTPPNPKTFKAQQDRDASIISHRWWLLNY